MNIDLVISADNINSEYLKNKVVVVIDMLRATSVITTALANGAKQVFPILTVEESFDKKKELLSKEDILIGGERKALKIDGFDFSNSPLEYTKENVNGKTIILSTTNGTRAINLSLKADEIIIGSILNAKAVALELKKLNKDVVFINAGTNGEFSMDDFICSGYMINLLSEISNCDLSDIAKTAKYIYENNTNLIDYIKEARHYSVLKALNLMNDLEYCCKKDILNIVPKVDKIARSIKI